MLRRATAAVFVLFVCCGIAAAQSLPVPSTWMNELGSYLWISTIDSNGNFKGTYVNNAAGFRCQSSPFDVTGVAGGSNIIFVVTWKNAAMSCNSLTEWMGTVSGGTINTGWQLAFPNMASGTIQVMTGNNTFQRIALSRPPAVKTKRPR